ncbi:MAG: hypothetical protein P8M65_09925 [Roseibacillus sp.]|nr:hypothetical protein [Roseibacillus sp.]
MKALTTLLAAIMITGCGPAEESLEAGDETTAKLQVMASYEGRLTLDPNEQSPEPSELIIRNQADYEAFVVRIPKRKITRTRPAPPSDDPLLGKPAIDFENNMILVAIRSDSMYVSPQFESIVADKNALIVRISDPDLGETGSANQQGGIGTYQAVVVPKRKGPIQFIR